jgi:hypothetical protein
MEVFGETIIISEEQWIRRIFNSNAIMLGLVKSSRQE